MRDKIYFNAYVTPICLPKEKSESLGSDSRSPDPDPNIPVGYVSGWGVKRIVDNAVTVSSKTLQIAAGLGKFQVFLPVFRKPHNLFKL